MTTNVSHRPRLICNECPANVLFEAEMLLQTEEFDLIIVSAWLSEWERGRILLAAGKTPAYVLPGFMLPRELLAQVDLLLPAVNKSSALRH